MVADGILGLSPSFINGNASGGDLFVNSLFYKNLIPKRMVSLAIARTTGTSKIHIGGYSS